MCAAARLSAAAGLPAAARAAARRAAHAATVASSAAAVAGDRDQYRGARRRGGLSGKRCALEDQLMAPPPVRDATAAAGRRRRRGQVQPPVDPLVMMSVVVVVYNVDRRPSTHASFHAAKRRYADGANGTARAPSLFAAGARFEFVVLHPNMEETEQAPARAASRRTLSTIERGNNSSSSPDQSFRSVVAARGVVPRQTLDVVAMLGDVISRFHDRARRPRRG